MKWSEVRSGDKGPAPMHPKWQILDAVAGSPPPPWMTPQADILGPKRHHRGGFPHRRYGAWTHLANGEGRCPPLCGPATEQ